MQKIKPVAEALTKAVEDNDFPAFNRAYLDFLKSFDLFKNAYSKTPTEADIKNPIFGGHGFYLKPTDDAEAAAMLEAGRKAAHVFGALSIAERKEFLRLLKKHIDAYQEAITLTITADTGKPVDLSKGEMAKGNEWFAFAADEMERQLGDQNGGAQVRSHKPLGVTHVIGAFNYPYALAIGGIVGALAAGNGVIVSAPVKAPNWVFPFMQAAHAAVKEFAKGRKPFAKIASGLIQCSIRGNRFLSANADAVHFVGSDAVGESIRHSRAGKRTILEMGGTNVVVVMTSAVKTQGAKPIADAIYAGYAPATGQRCTAPRILCIQKGAQEVSKLLKEKCSAGPSHAEIGNPFKPGVKMGPLVDPYAYRKMEEAIALARELGAEVHGNLRVGNNIVPQARNAGAFWVNPIVIDWAKANLADPENAKRVHNCLSREIFGPLLHVIHPVKNLEQAIEMTNALDTHGLAGAIFTADSTDAGRYQAATRVTSLMVNGGPKDQSPRGPHGHPGELVIGGATHFGLYTRPVVRTENFQFPP